MVLIGSVSLVFAQYYPYSTYTQQYPYNQYQYSNYNDYDHDYNYDYDGYYSHRHHTTNPQTYQYVSGCLMYQYNPYTGTSVVIGSVCPVNTYTYPYTTNQSYVTQYPYTTSYQNDYNNNNYNNNCMYSYSHGGWYPVSSTMCQGTNQSNTCYYQNGYMICY